jgi:hypothetical protein
MNKLLGIVAIVAIVLFIVMTAAGPGSRMGSGWSYLTTGSTTQQSGQPQALAAPSGPSIVGGPSLSASRIDTILSNAGSPSAGLGQNFYSNSVKYGIDDVYALAFYKHESTYGLYGEAVSSKSIGNIRCLDSSYSDLGTWCQDNFAFFPSWQNGIEAWYRLIKNQYVGKWGCSTVESIIPHYAPASDHNNEAAYASSVEQDVQLWRQS